MRLPNVKLTPIAIMDALSASAVLVALFYISENKGFWLLYLAGCLAYVGINYRKQLYGQAIMNVVAGSLAIKNFIG